MKRLLPLLLILPLAGFRPAPMPPPVYEGGPVRMALVDRDRGTELRSYPAEGQRWVAGERGHRYAVRLYNDSPAGCWWCCRWTASTPSPAKMPIPRRPVTCSTPDSAPTSPAGARAGTKWRSSSSAAPAAAMPAAPAAPTTSAWWAWPCSRKRAAGALSRSCAAACHRRRRLHRPKRPPMPAPAASRATPASRRRRRWAPATARASSPRCAIPSSSAPAAARRRCCSCATTAPATCARAASGRFAVTPAARTAGVPQPLRAGPAGTLILRADNTTPATFRRGRCVVGKPGAYL